MDIFLTPENFSLLAYASAGWETMGVTLKHFLLSPSRHISGKVETAGLMSRTSCLQCWYLPNCHLSHHLVEVSSSCLLSCLHMDSCSQHNHRPWQSLNLRPYLSAGCGFSWYSACLCVPQDSFLLDFTLLSNT